MVSLSNLPKVISRGTKTGTQICLTWKPIFFLPFYIISHQINHPSKALNTTDDQSDISDYAR